MKLRLTPETASDLLRGTKWFEGIASGLGDKFENDFYEALDRIKQNPQHFAPNQTGYRPCRLKRFTSVIYFRIDGDIVVVVALLTSGQDERVLEDRG